MNDGKKTIGIFLHALHYGGIEKFVETHRAVYDPQVNDCHIVVNRAGDKEQEEHLESLGFRVHLIPMKSPKSVSASARAGYKKLFDEIDFDIVHCNLPTNVLPLLYAERVGVPRKVIHSHSNYLLAISGKPAPVQAVYRHMMERNANRADVCLACSEEAAQVFGKNAGRTRIINNAVDFGAFAFDADKRASMRGRLGIEGDATVFCHVGRMENEIKNHKLLLSVFAAYRDQRPGAQLILVGDGKKRGEFESLARELGCADGCRFVGKTNAVADYLSASDMFLFPSKSEGLGISLVEAQASGIPCVVSDRVPVRARYMDNVAYVPIDKGVAPWLEAIDALMPAGRNAVDARVIAESGYSIEASSKILRSALGLDVE